ncbi:hypothetical protein PMIN04_004640 [Paraphaeosphaeria minitans]
MLGDAKLNSLDTRLEQFKLSNASTQQELQNLLKEHTQLLEDYKVLKTHKVTEQAHANGVSSASTLVNEKPRNTYAPVLVDGNGYVFNDELVKDKEEGGMRAARMLTDVVERLLREYPHARDSRLVVRIFADVTVLSKQLAKTKLIGLEKRSIMPFAAGFTRTMAHFDFVDVLDEEGTRFKIRETFKVAADDTACSHILFAACHDTSYIPQLVPYNGLQKKITLVQGAGFETDFYQLGLSVVQFPTIFRWSELAQATPTTKGSSTARTKSSTKAPLPAPPAARSSALDRGNWRHTSVNADGISYDSNGVIVDIPDFTADSSSANQGYKKTKPCNYFQKGFCRWGNKCSFVHTPEHVVPNQQTSSSPTTTSGADRENISSYLPTTVPPGFVALNKDGHRLDTYIRPPTSEEWFTYNARFHKQKPCNAHHLSGTCNNFNCPFDHHPLEVETQHCLEYVLKSSPCPRRGACRDRDCFHGHVCQKDGCVGHHKGCRLKADAHSAEPKLVSMVPATTDDSIYEDLIGVVVSDVGAYEAAW